MEMAPKFIGIILGIAVTGIFRLENQRNPFCHP